MSHYGTCHIMTFAAFQITFDYRVIKILGSFDDPGIKNKMSDLHRHKVDSGQLCL
jgi:hypothetical protein